MARLIIGENKMDGIEDWEMDEIDGKLRKAMDTMTKIQNILGLGRQKGMNNEAIAKACEYTGSAKYWIAKAHLAVLKCKRERAILPQYETKE
tara:strand:+ start:556 stop:831 length:276 start_codon:yes stop_codon:yes gene_type:complete